MIEKDPSRYEKEEAFLNRNEIENTKETENFENTGRERTQSVYVISLSPIRMGILLAVIVFAVILMFSIGFQTGVKKNAKTNNIDSGNADILFRDNAETNNINENIIENSRNQASSSSIIDMSSIKETTPSNYDERDMKITGASQNDTSYTLAKDFEEVDRTFANKIQNTSATDMQVSKVPGANVEREPYVQPKAAEEPKKAVPPVQVKSEAVKTKPQVASVSKEDKDVVYFIQVAVVASKAAAETDKDFLKKRFPRAFVKEDIAKDGSKVYKVKIGRYENKADIENALAELKNIAIRYKDSYIYSDKK